MKDVTNTVMIFLHLFGVVAAIGGVHYVVTVLTPLARRMGEPAGPDLLAAAGRKFRAIVWVSIVLITLSGLHLMFARGHLKSPNLPMLLLKVALALVVFGISLGLTLPIKAFGQMQRNRLFWQRMNLVVAAIVLFLAAWLLSQQRPVA